VQFGKGTQIQFRREYLATNPLEDEDDDEDENDVPHERPNEIVFAYWFREPGIEGGAVTLTHLRVASPVGRPFSDLFGGQPRADAVGCSVQPLRGNRRVAVSRHGASPANRAPQ